MESVLFGEFGDTNSHVHGLTRRNFVANRSPVTTICAAIFAFACLGTAGAASAADLAPGNGHSVRLAQFNGVLYYTVEPDGYRIVATLAAGPEALPIRFTSTLGPGQRAVISVPQSANQPSIDFEVVRNGDVLVVKDPVKAEAAPISDVVESAAPSHLATLVGK